MRFPSLIFVLSFVTLWLSVKAGIFLRHRMRPLDQESREDFSVIQGATLTLLGLIIGFSFSMAISRYDQRKIYEEEEANAIGTEFLRVEVLPAADAAHIKDLLKKYLDQRMAFYTTRDTDHLKQIEGNTARLQAELWSAARTGAEKSPTPLTALAASGMNDVLNSQGYSQAAWLNRIPLASWLLMAAMAFVGSLMVGIGAHRPNAFLTVALPLVISIAFFLVGDLDSPRRGLIRVSPQNLISLSESLKAG
jgi:hypothetical protein